MVKVALICTSADKVGDHPTGLWLEEAAAPYFLFKDEGYDVDIFSPKGGPIPIDAGSLADGYYTPAAKKFKEEDTVAWNQLQESKQIDVGVIVKGYDAIFLSGGHGTCTDFITKEGPSSDNVVTKLIESFYASGKPLAAVCHAPVALCDAKKPNGEPLVKGLTMTAFTNVEEEQVQLANIVPFIPEGKAIELGATFVKNDPWQPKACVDGNVITGQNPQSSEAAAELLIEALSSSSCFCVVS